MSAERSAFRAPPPIGGGAAPTPAPDAVGRRFVIDGTEAVLLGRTLTGRYAYAVPSVRRAGGDRPVVRSMSRIQAEITLGLAVPWPRSTDGRGPWARP